MLAAWFAFGERPNAAEALGGAVMLVGVLLALRPPARARVSAPTPCTTARR
jgi:drug/metabolite transporter (DMT)-like permease